MILNGYTILSVFFCLLRLVMSLLVVGVGWSAWRMVCRTPSPEGVEAGEHRSYLLVLSATILIGINFLSWPILYAVLQSYVAQWPSIMCIYGVTKIGAGTVGASRFLPSLLTGLQWTKPLLVFFSGAAFVLYVINRRTQTASIQRRVVLALVLVGASTMVDAVVEGAYLAIPKAEIRLAGGCCTESLDSIEQAAKFTPRIRVSDAQRPYLTTAYFALNVAMILGLFVSVVVTPRQGLRRWRWLLAAGGLLSIPVSLLFLIEVAAPAILGLPFHHCPYDLIPSAPESVVAVALFLLGCFSVGWAMVAARFGDSPQSRAFLPEFTSRLLFIALFGYAGSLLLISLELFLAGRG